MANVLNFIKKTLIASIKFAFIITLVFFINNNYSAQLCRWLGRGKSNINLGSSLSFFSIFRNFYDISNFNIICRDFCSHI